MTRPPPRRGLSDRAVAAWRVDGLRRSLFLGVVVVGLLGVVLRDVTLVVATGGVAVTVMVAALVVVAPSVYARTWRYEVDDDELYLQRGWLTITRHVVPLLRVQNVDTVQGPIDRLFGLASVTLSTAGGAATIPHLDEPVAEELRAKIAARVRVARGASSAGAPDAP